jgi:transcription antitermination factor NusG
MATLSFSTVEPRDSSSSLPVEYFEPHWYATYLRANHEKKVAAQLEVRGIESYLPLYESVRRWKDRRVHLQLPLFPGYVFVRIALRDRLGVLEIPSVARLVRFNGHPAPLPSAEIETLRLAPLSKLNVQPCPYLKVGRRVRIRSGPLEGLGGILLRQKSCYRVVLSIEMLQKSVIANVDLADIEPVN